MHVLHDQETGTGFFVQGSQLTNLERLIQAGQIGDHVNGRYFEAGLDDMVAARLVNISGNHSTDKFNSLNFH